VYDVERAADEAEADPDVDAREVGCFFSRGQIMHQQRSVREEETLDPEDWQAIRQLGHRMVDDMVTYLQTVRERPVWQPVPPDVGAQFDQPVPTHSQGAERAYEDFTRYVLPYPMGNIHPRFWGWVIGTGTPLGVLAEMLAAGMNPNVGGGNHVANLVELQVLNWCKEMLGYPPESSGLLVSGASMANLIGLTVARNAKAGYELRKDGLQASKPRMVVYGSQEMHSSVQKAVELLGLGSDALRRVGVDGEYQIDVHALDESIARDRDAGHHPFCVVGNAGTVNTGAIDDLDALADICARQDLWLHVDGAFGALAALSPALRPLLKGMERADSLAFDMHKWMYVPYEVGCILVRREADQRLAFSLTPAYLAHADRGLAAGSVWFSDYGIQLSRGFRALKVWMSLKEHGSEKYGRLIQQNVDQARYLAGLVDAASDLQRLAPVSLNIVCFRFVVDRDDATLNRLNEEIVIQLHERGIAVPSYATINGKYALRVAITNHRSRYQDFDLLVREVVRLGKDLARKS
jgi:aromatic-L-amino-acid/L-tryptophan decarboxylase